MKDMKNQEIHVGDSVLYTSDRGGPKLTIGTVIATKGNCVKIDRKTAAGYYPIVDGMQKRCRYVKSEWVETTKKVIPVWIGIPERCLILERAQG